MGGILIASAFMAIAWLSPDRGSPAFMIALGAAVAGYGLAAAAIAAGVSLSTRLLILAAAAALLWRLPLLATPPLAAHDAVRYVWDARVQRAGISPYEARPDDPALAQLHTPLTRTVDAAWLPTIYGPGAQLYFRAVAAVGESILGFRVATIVLDAAIMAALALLLRAIGRPPSAMLLYAWHPLPALEGASGAHVDVLGALLLVVAALALAHRRTAAAGLAFAAAVMVKPLPIVLLPLLWGRLRARDVLFAVAVMSGLTLWVTRGSLPFGSTGAFIDEFRFNGPLFGAALSMVSPRTAAASAVAGGLLAAAWLRGARDSFLWAWPLAAALLFAPVIYPWYLVWLLPLLAVQAALPLLVWTVSITVVYVAWHARAAGAPLEVSHTLLALEFAPPVLAAVWLAVSRWRGLRLASSP